MREPDWVRRMNYLGFSVGGAHHLVDADWEELRDIAVRITGCSDFSDDEYTPQYRQIETLSKEMSLLQLLLMKKTILMGLRNRLLVTREIQRMSAIPEEVVRQPLIISGLQRTGTSILFELLAQDTACRTPLGFEVYLPVANAEGKDLTGDCRALSECEFEFMLDVCPTLKCMHEFRSDLPVDCAWVMKSVLSMSTTNAYRWHRRILQLLQLGRPEKTWLLKCVSHLSNLGDVFTHYPDARVILTHRDPVKSISSGIHILREASPFLFVSPHVLTTEFSYEYMKEQKSTWRKVIDERASGVIPDDRIADILFADLLKDPVNAIKGAYEKLGLSFHEDFAAAILRYLDTKPRHKFGKNEYAAADFGLSDEEIREQFGFYTNHYSLECGEV